MLFDTRQRRIVGMPGVTLARSCAFWRCAEPSHGLIRYAVAFLTVVSISKNLRSTESSRSFVKSNPWNYGTTQCRA